MPVVDASTSDTEDVPAPAPSNSWSLAAPTGAFRFGHSTTVLQDGRVLVAGGLELTDAGAAYGPSTPAAEIYDPNANSWSPTGSMSVGRQYHSATLLSDGRVLVVGGEDPSRDRVLDSAEIYDPSAGTWHSTEKLIAPHSFHAAARLASGEVLVAGGFVDAYAAGYRSLPLPPRTKLTEIFDPVSEKWTRAGDLNAVNSQSEAALLNDGRVLVTGGGEFFSVTEIFDPGTMTWSVTGSPSVNRSNFALTTLTNGQVLIVGGGVTDNMTSCEVYYPAGGVWAITGSLAKGRAHHDAILLRSGKVLVVGGANPQAERSTELFEPISGTWSVGPVTSAFRIPGSSQPGGSLVRLLDGDVLAVGNELTSGWVDTRSVERYHP